MQPAPPAHAHGGFVTDDPWGDRVLGMTPAELDALIAYLQMLGTLVDFKLYNEKANLR